MPEQPKKSRSLIPLYMLIVLFYTIAALSGGGDNILSESVSHESDFQVNLAEGINLNSELRTLTVPKK